MAARLATAALVAFLAAQPAAAKRAVSRWEKVQHKGVGNPSPRGHHIAGKTPPCPVLSLLSCLSHCLSVRSFSCGGGRRRPAAGVLPPGPRTNRLAFSRLSSLVHHLASLFPRHSSLVSRVSLISPPGAGVL